MWGTHTVKAGHTVAGLVAVLAGLALAGCATFRPPEGLAVSLVNARLVEATVLETTAVFTVRLENERAEDIRLEGGVHKFYLGGVYIGQGLSNEHLAVPRLASVTQQVTVHLRNLALARRVKPMLEQRKADYRVDSVLYLERSGRTARVRVSNSGQVDLREFQPGRPPDS